MKYETLWRRLTGIYDTDEAKAIVRWALDVRFGLSLTDIVCGKIDENRRRDRCWGMRLL